MRSRRGATLPNSETLRSESKGSAVATGRAPPNSGNEDVAHPNSGNEEIAPPDSGNEEIAHPNSGNEDVAPPNLGFIV